MIVALTSVTGVIPQRLLVEPFHVCCTMEDCKRYYVKPNLTIAAGTHLSGFIEDASGAALSMLKVELRRWISPKRQDSIRMVMTDANGFFDAGEIEKGRYRLLPSPVNYMRQPEPFECPDRECEPHITLRPTPTDTVEAMCPVR